MDVAEYVMGGLDHKNDIQICKDLHYPQEFIDKITQEEDPLKRQRMMVDARRKYL